MSNLLTEKDFKEYLKNVDFCKKLELIVCVIDRSDKSI